MKSTGSYDIILSWKVDKQEFTSTVPLGPSDNVFTFNLAPGYNQYHQFCAAAAVNTWDEEDTLVQEPDIVSDVEDIQPTLRAKDNPIGRIWTGHTPSVQPYEISDDEDIASTPEVPRGMVFCIPISPYQYQEDKAKDAQPRHVTLNMESSLQSEEQQSTTDDTVAEFLRLHYMYGQLSFKKLKYMAKLGIISKKF